ncbi:MAG: choice-of-anchor J domain-containing protein, partial [Duncaniella sp.]|nr:choice-of-anchor J domain-containing protein [Duncaniella sp.]
MKKNLTRIFSVLLAAATALSATAAPLEKRAKSPAVETTQLRAAGTKVKAKAPAKADNHTRVLTPKFRTAETRNPANLFRAATKRNNIPVKAPYKINAKADAVLPNIMGSMTWSDAWNDADEYAIGLYSIPTNASQTFDLKFLGPNANYGGVLVDNVYYTCDVLAYGSWILGVNYVGYDINSGEVVYSSEFEYYTSSMTYDTTTGTVYAIAVVEDQYGLTRLSFEGEELGFDPFAVVEPENLGMWNSIACDASGQLWGIYGNYEVDDDSYVCTGSTLYKINKTTGDLTKIGDTGFDCTYMTDATFDLKTNKLYWTVSPAEGTGFITEVNTSTGAAEIIYNFPLNEEVTGLAIPAPVADDKAPAAVTDAKAEFENGSLSGTVSFNAPATLFDGTAASGSLTYSVEANGEEVATGSTTFGAAVSAAVTMPSNGTYTFTITVANETGESPKTQIKNVYVGKDAPAAPAVTAVYDSETNTATVSWTAVIASANGGYMDASAVTYTVTRYPGAEVVAENITGTSLSDVLPEPEGLTKFYYEVVASCDGLVSAAGVSDIIVVGSGLVPPFTVTFDDAEDLDMFTIIDANGDNKAWEYYNGYVRMNYNSSLDMDDWLITPPVKLEAGKVYDVLADIWAQNSSYKERIEVKIGKTPTVDGMTTVVLAPTEIKTASGDPYKLSKPVIVDEPGSYYIGFHGISDRDMFYLCLKNIGVAAPRSSDGPAAVSDFSVTADPTGAFNVTVSFVTPDKTISNAVITSLDKVELSRDNEVIKTWNNPAVGESLSFTDALDKSGDYLYSVVAYNSEGAGLAVESSVFVGFDYPESPSNITLVETATPGEITIAWDAVTKDVRGNTMPASEVTYQVYAIDGYYRDPVSEKISETSYTFQAVEPGKQDFVQYLVFAYSSGGESEGSYTPFKAVGTPYTAFSVSSPNDLSTYPLASDEQGGAAWSVGTNETFSDVPEASDGDGYYFYMTGEYIGNSAELFTGKIDLSATSAPGMIIYCMPVAPDDINPLTITVTDVATNESTVLFSKPVNETGAPLTWNKITIDLADYAQKTVQFTVGSIVEDYSVVLVDGWKVASLLNNDLSVASVVAPGKVKAGEAYTVDVTVANEGLKDAGAFSVELYADGELYGT